MITVGSDIEYFVYDTNTHLISSAIGKIGGSKHNPLVIPFGNLQEDNILAEIGIDPVTLNEDDSVDITNAVNHFSNYILSVRSQLNNKLYEKNLLTTSLVSSVVSQDVIDMGGFKATQFSCEPDYNAYTEARNPKIDPKVAGNFRCAGGHLHCSWDISSYGFNPLDFVKMLDITLGFHSVIMDDDKQRRKLYGKAGDFRPKKYPDGSVGIEYRTLSNYWTLTDRRIRNTFKLLIKAFKETANGNLQKYIDEIGSTDEIQRIINDYDVDAASYYINLFEF